jgi:hypothetical protein
MENKWRKIQCSSGLEKGFPTKIYFVAGGWGEEGGEVRACRKRKASATDKAHMKLNRKQDKNVRI